MSTPKISCKIHITCPVHPTESVEKIRQTLTNIFPELEFEQKENTIHTSSIDLKCLEKISEEILNRQLQKSFQKQFRKNLHHDSLWFYLNKQAAFADVVALCEHDDESPLGPIKVSIRSSQIENVANWLTHA